MTSTTNHTEPVDAVTAASPSTQPGTTVHRTPGAAERDYVRWARRQRALHRALALSLPLVLLVLWEVGARWEWFDDRFFSSPTAIWDRAWQLVKDGTLQEELLVTARRLFIGYGLGATAGILLGLVLSQFRLARAAVEPTLRGLYVIPKLAILPILLLVFGLGETPKVVFVALGVFFILAFSTLTAATMVPAAYHEAASAYRLTRLQRFRWLVLPGALPQIVAATRLASGIGVLLVVAVEFVSSNDGVGYLTWHAWELFVADQMYVGILTISIFGVAFSACIGAIGNRLCPWATDEHGSL